MRLLGKIAHQLILLGLLLAPALGQTPNVIPGCIYLASPPTLTDKQRSPLLCDANGNLSTSGGGGTPGGSDLQVQYNNAGAFGGMAGTSWDNTNRALTITGATVTADNPTLSLTQTWNNAAVTFNGFKLNVTDTASAAFASLFTLQVGGATRFQVFKSGNVNTIGDLGISSLTGRVTFRNGGSYISSPASATIQIGNADSSAPIAQTLQAQSATGTNISGLNWTINGSTSTGSGTAGDILLQTGGTGAGATAQNSFVTALTIKGATQNVIVAKQLVPGTVLVSALPTGVEGGLINVSDQLTTCPIKGGTFTGGGAVTCLAHFEEGAWVAP